MSVPRAQGVRRRYDEIPGRVRQWVESSAGARVTEAREQVGGMSPGCATRLRFADGTRAFVKAVGPELNPMTPELFRHERAVLEHLGPDPLWAGLVASYDEAGGWVALLLEDVDGRHPDLGDPDEAGAVLQATDRLVERLRGCAQGIGIGSLAESLGRLPSARAHLDELSADHLPGWTVDAAPEMYDVHLPALVANAASDGLANYDIRNDNLLLRPDGRVVFVDWGMSRTGPRWLDPLVVRLEWAEDPSFDQLVAGNPPLRALGDGGVTTYLYLLGCWLAYRSTVAEDVGLPALKEFRRRESARFLAGARRRMGG